MIAIPTTTIQTNRQRDEDLPAEPHDLVVAVAREGRAQPQEQEHEEDELADEPVHPGSKNHPTKGASCSPGTATAQPPRNMSTVSAQMRIMFAYSAMKNTENDIPEYSTWKPATISDSPSATSKGARLVSAIPEIR